MKKRNRGFALLPIVLAAAVAASIFGYAAFTWTNDGATVAPEPVKDAPAGQWMKMPAKQ